MLRADVGNYLQLFHMHDSEGTETTRNLYSKFPMTCFIQFLPHVGFHSENPLHWTVTHSYEWNKLHCTSMKLYAWWWYWEKIMQGCFMRHVMSAIYRQEFKQYLMICTWCLALLRVEGGHFQHLLKHAISYLLYMEMQGH